MYLGQNKDCFFEKVAYIKKKIKFGNLAHIKKN